MCYRKPVFILFALSSLAACDSSTTGPDLETAESAEALLLSAERPQVGQAPLLEQLFKHAVAVIARTQGREAAAEVLNRVDRIKKAAAEARAGGDIELARRLIGQMKMEMAEVVVRVMGPGVANRVMAAAAHRLHALEMRIERLEEAGAEVPAGLHRLAEKAGGLLAAARDALGKGEPAQALLLGVNAYDVLSRPVRR